MEIVFSRFRLSIRLQSIFFPAQATEMTRQLAASGFEIVVPGDELMQGLGGARVEMTGRVAIKDGSLVDLNMEKGIIGLNGIRADRTEADFALVEAAAAGLFDVYEAVWFYETIINGTAFAGEDATAIVGRLPGRVPILAAAGKIWGEELTSYGLRLTSVGRKPNQEEWTDIKMEPDIRRGDLFVFEGVRRSREKERVLEFMRNFAERLQGTLAIMQGES